MLGLNDYNSNDVSKIVDFNDWLASIGKTRATGWRWRKKGVILTINVFGRLYVTRDEIIRFEQRVIAGDFCRSNNVGSGKK